MQMVHPSFMWRMSSLFPNLWQALLISWLSTLHWGVVSLIFFLLGILMFLLPVVPGLAVYLSVR